MIANYSNNNPYTKVYKLFVKSDGSIGTENIKDRIIRLISLKNRCFLITKKLDIIL